MNDEWITLDRAARLLMFKGAGALELVEGQTLETGQVQALVTRPARASRKPREVERQAEPVAPCVEPVAPAVVVVPVLCVEAVSIPSMLRRRRG